MKVVYKYLNFDFKILSTEFEILECRHIFMGNGIRAFRCGKPFRGR